MVAFVHATTSFWSWLRGFLRPRAAPRQKPKDSHRGVEETPIAQRPLLQKEYDASTEQFHSAGRWHY